MSETNIKPFVELRSRYMQASSRYLEDAELLLQKGDLPQASEKYWGAAAMMVKTVAAKRNKKLKSHNELWHFVADLEREHPEMNLKQLFMVIGYLHANFYEVELNADQVETGAKAVKEFISKLESLL
jgi:hypothetical protein